MNLHSIALRISSRVDLLNSIDQEFYGAGLNPPWMKSKGKDLYEGKIDDGWILEVKDLNPPEFSLNGKRMELEDIIKKYKSKSAQPTPPSKEEPELVTDPDGSKFWYLNDKLHREDGPAVEYSNGSKEWYLNGERHREDGPAVEFPNGYKEWWLNGKEIDKDIQSNDPKVKALQALM